MLTEPGPMTNCGGEKVMEEYTEGEQLSLLGEPELVLIQQRRE